MKTRKLSLLALGLSFACTASAQEQDSARISQLNTVVVTATKFAKKQSETGKVLTVITREQIERNVGRTVTDLLNEQAGVVINGAGSNAGKNKELYFRGATSQYTPILLDGIPVADATGLTGGAIDLRLLPIDAIERIEILRGTQSTLYGADAIAGIINIITKKGSGKPVNGYGNLSWGSNRSLKGTAGLQGRKDNVDYNIAFTHFTTDGISEAAPPENTPDPSRFDKDGFKTNSLMANVGIQATDRLRVTPYLLFSDYKSKYDKGSFQDTATNNNKSDMLHTGARGVYDFGKGKAYANFGYQKVTRYDESSWGITNTDGRAYFGELYGHYDITGWLQALAGVEYRKSEMLDTNQFKTTPFGYRSQHSTSPYVSLFIRNLHGFNLELGGRYMLHNQFGNHFTYSINPSYLIHEKVKVFASVASGFKAPTLISLYSSYGNKDLKPEKAISYEAGVQTSLIKDKLELRVTGFKRDVTNMISYINYKYINYNKQNDKGVEVELSIHPVKGLDVKAFYTYMDGLVTTQAVPGKDTSYNNLYRRPAHTATLNAGYRFSRFYVGTNIRHIGNRDDIYYAPGSFTGEPYALKAYTIWDMYAEYRFSNNSGKLFVNANNIANNKKYWEIYGYSVQGFTLQAGIAFQF